MVLRVAFFVLMALGLVAFATVAWMTVQAPQPVQIAAPVTPPAPVVVPEPPPMLPKVLVAARALDAGALLKPDDVEGKPVGTGEAKGAISAETQDALRSLVGSMVRRAMAAGQPFRPDDVMKPGDHGFLAAALQSGMRAVTIGVDAASGAAGLVWPGDRVDLILTQTLTDPQLPIGSRVAADTILTNTRVIAIDQQMVQGGAPAATTGGGENLASTVTLEVTPEQAQRVSVAMRLGRLSLSVRSSDVSQHGDAATSQGGPVFARDVSSALGAMPAAPANKVIHIYHGPSEPKEYKY